MPLLINSLITQRTPQKMRARTSSTLLNLLFSLFESPPHFLSFPFLLYISLISFIFLPFPSLFLSLPLHVSSKIFASSPLIFNAESKHAKMFKPCGLGVQAYKTSLFSYIFHVAMLSFCCEIKRMQVCICSSKICSVLLSWEEKAHPVHTQITVYSLQGAAQCASSDKDYNISKNFKSNIKSFLATEITNSKHVFIYLKLIIYYYMLDCAMMEISLCYRHLCIYHYDTLQHREG